MLKSERVMCPLSMLSGAPKPSLDVKVVFMYLFELLFRMGIHCANALEAFETHAPHLPCWGR